MIGIVYARTGSTRFPRKCFASFDGVPMVKFICEKLLKSKLAKVYVATTKAPSDDDLEKLFDGTDVSVFRGEENDLVKRTVDLLKESQAEAFCRINGDSPLFDVDLTKHAIEQFNKGYDLVSNIISRTYPYGVSAEIINSNYYINSSYLALDSDLEHVTQHLYRNLPKKFLSLTNDCSLEKFRFTIDTYDDYNNILSEMHKLKKDICSITYADLINARNSQANN